MINLNKIKNLDHITTDLTNLLRNGLHNEILGQEVEVPFQTRDIANNIDDLAQLQFLQYHTPTITAGRYKVSTTQQMGGVSNDLFKSKDQYFSVGADRYQLPPQEQYFVFPPVNDKGLNSAVLPHIILNRSTSPWERESSIKATAGVGMNKPGWLILLMLTEDESAQIPLVRKKTSEVGLEQADDTPEQKKSLFNFLEINGDNKNLIQKLLPQPKDIQYLAHTMVKYLPKTDTSPVTHQEKSVLICPRFPTPGKGHTVHLISIEDAMFKDFVNADNSWNSDTWNNISNEKKKYLISLHGWSFFCKSTPISGEPAEGSKKNLQISFRQLLQQATIAPFRMEYTDNGHPQNSGIKSYIEKGYVPMPHYLRKGEKTVSWYHGPLVPLFKKWKGITVTNSTSADDYLMQDKNSQLLDVSYAAAWQLGRNLTLKNKVVAKQLYFWRRSIEQKLKQQLLDRPSFITPTQKPASIPDFIWNWVNQIFRLEHIPFNYLVPHPSMLPKETLRFVRLDFNWIVALIEGILSVGVDSSAIISNTPAGQALKKIVNRDFNILVSEAVNFKPLSGFLLRSKVVEDFPDLHFIGRDSNDNDSDTGMPLALNRKIGADIRICLFQSENAAVIDKKTLINKVEAFTQPRGRHFGIYTDVVDNKNIYKKRLRAYDVADLQRHGKFITAIAPDNSNKICTEFELDSQIVDWEGNRCVDIDALVNKMDEVATYYNIHQAAKVGWPPIEAKVKNSSANFAFHMIEGAPKVKLWMK